MSNPVYTVGHEKSYDQGLENYLQSVLEGRPRPFRKLGRDGSYPGGYAVKTPEDAARLIAEEGPGRGWAVYELDADWEKDTVPSENGWWHALVNSSPILRKVNI